MSSEVNGTTEIPHVKGHFILAPDVQKNLSVVLETALTELAENTVAEIIDKRFNDIVQGVLIRTLGEQQQSVIQYLADNFCLTEASTQNIVHIIEAAVQDMADKACTQIVDDNFDTIFRHILAANINSKVQVAMRDRIANLKFTIE